MNGHEEKYDAIFMDFTFPFSFDVARLYSVEFLSIVANTLKEEGIFIHSTPFPQTMSDDVNIDYYDLLISSTYGTAGLKNLLMYSDPQNSFILASKNGKKWTENYNDLGLDFKTNTKLVFTEKVYRYLPKTIMPDKVNSLFKPLFMGIRDHNF